MARNKNKPLTASSEKPVRLFMKLENVHIENGQSLLDDGVFGVRPVKDTEPNERLCDLAVALHDFLECFNEIGGDLVKRISYREPV